MDLFDPPAISLRKRVPQAHLHDFNIAEEFALHYLNYEPAERKPYQLGIVLALWIKDGEMARIIELPRSDSRKVQTIYESCLRVIKGEADTAFKILQDLAEENHTFGVPATFYGQLRANMLMWP